LVLDASAWLLLADVATSTQDLDRTKFAETIAGMEARLAEKEGSELDRAIERLDHFKSIQNELNSTAMHSRALSG
jgi:F-type H+-transporting ATPase subunit epsilon